MLSIRTLAKACAYGTFGLTGIVIFVHEEIQGRIRKSECYIEAFKHLDENKGAVEYFGQPLKAGYANNINESEDQSDSVLWYKVPLKGPDGKGLLYYKTVKEQNWYLSRVEVELDKLPGRKFLIMDKSPDQSPDGEQPIERESEELEEGETTNDS